MPEAIGIVAAHPDDEVLGAGGTIARLAAEGHAVHVLILGEGADARGEDAGARLHLAEAAREAAKVLGVASLRHPLEVEVEVGYTPSGYKMASPPDNRFDGWDLLDLVQPIEQWLREHQPRRVFTHTPICLNIDHRLTAQAVLTATRPGTSSVRAVYAWETPSATEWAFGQLGGAFVPTLFYDITGEPMLAKLEALAAYQSELRAWPHPRSIQGIEGHAMYWGMAAGVPHAEAFMVVREVR